MEKPSNLILVIFGATGDLTSRKLIPALYSLRTQNLMPERFALLGLGRSELTAVGLKSLVENAIKTYSDDIVPDEVSPSLISGCVEFLRIDYDNPDDYSKISRTIENLCTKSGIGRNIIFYAAR